MNGLALGFAVFDALLLLLVPRRWATLPVLAAACYVPIGAGFDIGPFNFYVIRLVLMVAFLRMLLKGEGLQGGMSALDWLIVTWALVALLTSLFHEDVSSTLINRMGLVFMSCGSYFVLRVFCPSHDDTVRLCRMAAMLLVPVALSMLYEKSTGSNPFAEFGGIPYTSEIRNGTIRAQGAFAHSILAGSVGAACLPLMAVLWRTYRNSAVLGTMACLAMVFSSGSTGPIMSTGFGVLALLMWRARHHMRLVRWGALLLYIGLDLVMNAPAYYALAYIDLTGSSTSWHRAALIEAAVTHWSEWRLAGTDMTRHWMPYGVGWSRNHIDITNYYIRMGVDGGMPLLLMFIAVLSKGFSLVGRTWRHADGPSAQFPYGTWALGASLFAQAATFMSVSYFDQSVVFLYLTLAAIGSQAMHSVHAQPASVHDAASVPIEAAYTRSAAARS
jgi:hypothetical protein